MSPLEENTAIHRKPMKCRKHDWRRLFAEPQTISQRLYFSIWNCGRYHECVECGRIGWQRKSRRAPIVNIDLYSEPAIRQRATAYAEMRADVTASEASR